MKTAKAFVPREKPKKRKGIHVKSRNKGSTFKKYNGQGRPQQFTDYYKRVATVVTHSYNKLKSGDELTASEMKVCLEICKQYSKDPIAKKEVNLLDSVPFDTPED